VNGSAPPVDGSVLDIRRIELTEVALPLVHPFRTSFGEERVKRAILVMVEAAGATGWGECVASEEPGYSEEWLAGAWIVLESLLAPSLMAGGPVSDPADVGRRLRWVRGHRMAKAAVEGAVLDAWLRQADRSLPSYLGAVRDRVPCGVSVGIAPTVDAMLEEIERYLEQGYRRVKLKIEPGRDLEVVKAIRGALPDTALSVDANGAYSLADAPVFEALDELDLVMIEQPLDHEDLLDHAKLQRRLSTPVCLDESIRSAADAAAALELGACRVINIKPGRVGGLLEARRIHNVAVQQDVPVWIGGMLETGVGRAANLALAAMPGVTMPGDTSASDRYFPEDLTDPFVLRADGTMAVPSGPGVGVEPKPDRLEACRVRATSIPAP
jgi:O-succinylbenzoate synthase